MECPSLGFSSFLLLLIITFSNCDQCDDVDCGPGTCIDGKCVCPEGFSGINCEIEDLCLNVICGPGTCVNGICDCPDGYTGVNCEIEIDPCEGIECGYGNCVDGHCECIGCYTGEFCDIKIHDPENFIGTWRSENHSCDSNELDTVILTISMRFDELSLNWLNFDISVGIGPFAECDSTVQFNDYSSTQPNASGSFTLIDSITGTLNMDVIANDMLFNCEGTFTRQ